MRKTAEVVLIIIFLASQLAACVTPPLRNAAVITVGTTTEATAEPGETPEIIPLYDHPLPDGITLDQYRTLTSLRQVDDHPLYTMDYSGVYFSWEQPNKGGFRTAEWKRVTSTAGISPWGCSLFAALGSQSSRLYGRNFDWEFSPALLLFTKPPDGYASVSMVDIAYLGFVGENAYGIADLPLEETFPLLDAPFLPFDGMNEEGLVVGMAAVPGSPTSHDPAKETVGSLGIIREMLDHASNVEQAMKILGSYNIDFSGGPPVHYLLADRSGKAVLVEFYEREMVVFPNQQPWHFATNFLLADAGDIPEGRCWRYDLLNDRLSSQSGSLAVPQALKLLESVSQPNTQWSVVYTIDARQIDIVMGGDFENILTFNLRERP